MLVKPRFKPSVDVRDASFNGSPEGSTYVGVQLLRSGMSKRHSVDYDRAATSPQVLLKRGAIGIVNAIVSLTQLLLRMLHPKYR